MTASVFEREQLLFEPTVAASDAVNLVLAFPNTYDIGITSLGYQVVWATLACRGDVNVARYFTDVHESLPSDLDLLGFSLSWELDYGNILDTLDALQIPLRAGERSPRDPLVFGGGPVLTANPEPYAEFFDVILLGDGEDLLGAFIETYQQVRGDPREAQLLALAQVPGIYIPSLYQVSYEHPEGAIAAITPLHAQVPAEVVKQTYRGDRLSASTVVTDRAAWENIYMVEVVRSCPELCRFCLASYLTLPFRTPHATDSLIPLIEQGLKVTNRIGLLGASVTQHPEFETLLHYFDRPQCDGVRLSVASMRTNTITPRLATTLANHGTRSVTIAIESGSERVRNIVNKKLDQADIFRAAEHARAGGLKGVKFYGMAGIPGEVPADLEATAQLMLDLKKAVPGLKLTLGCSTFVPKAHTPFQWMGVNPEAKKRLPQLQKRLAPKGIEFRPESYNWSIIQGLLSRGDRRLGRVLELTRRYGDSVGSIRRAFKELRGQVPALEFYVFENWPSDRVLPWEHLRGPLPKSTLLKHLQDAKALME
ncbi:B12-binding domain-containing radical SAM protein [Lyngbya confervoides]|uniref:B12-binding domain-containing radical SAM protein n=1 Tax=Lyngbya confervoides BDU141951 TaxID=1574623 RepID=A0ABD4T4Q0_9CYAN|nr:radical SAM protein [Lyngbya confervoides]MCM1983411.1 B12-binding domain-containing radical SAM protein [Lyngbya confervoides BDU141951]